MTVPPMIVGDSLRLPPGSKAKKPSVAVAASEAAVPPQMMPWEELGSRTKQMAVDVVEGLGGVVGGAVALLDKVRWDLGQIQTGSGSKSSQNVFCGGSRTSNLISH